MRHMGEAKEAAYRAGLLDAAQRGRSLLDAGGSAIDACRIAVRAMEASGAFNAGLGSGLTRAGRVEIDAAVMHAADRSIGAVAAVPGVSNGVDLAEAVRCHSPHCLLVGEGAAQFAQGVGVGVDRFDPSPAKLERYQVMLQRDAARSAEDLAQFAGTHDEGDTVGAVALDTEGHIACAVSTGGIWLKSVGRVGDSPLAGSGFWAEAGVGAAVATGTGEFIMRDLMSARAVWAMQDGLDASRSAQAVSEGLAARFGPDKAGLITIDSLGRLGFAFATQGMGRAAVWHDSGEPIVAVWPDEEPTA